MDRSEPRAQVVAWTRQDAGSRRIVRHWKSVPVAYEHFGCGADAGAVSLLLGGHTHNVLLMSKRLRAADFAVTKKTYGAK
jgi:hypothetical protein